MERADILVIGAGISGLVAARDLSNAGLRVHVVEARDALGGRIATVKSADWPLPMELGPEFVHGSPDATLRLFRTLGVTTTSLTDVHDRVVKGRFQRESGLWERLARILEGQGEGEDRSAGAFLREGTLSADDAEWLRLIIEGFHAAPVDDVSLTSVAGDSSASGEEADESQSRPDGGYGPVIERLVASLDPDKARITRCAPVRTVEWRRGHVTARVESASGLVRVTAPRALVTVSLGVLQGRCIRFEPELASKHVALQSLAMGHVVKVVLCFRGDFWKNGKAPPDLGMFHIAGATFPTFWKVSQGDFHQVIAWAGGPRALELADASDAEVVATAVESLAETLGVAVNDARAALVGSAQHRYSRDPFIRGAYSYLRPGGKDAHAALAAPIDDTLYFAGEATDAKNSGTVAGAIASGERAAREVFATHRGG